MALQTQTHTGITDAPTGTPPPNDASSSHGNGTPFSPAGSPPLILAFLAIGLFSAAMIVVFGWRRIQFGRFTIGGPPPNLQSRNGPKVPFVLPQKPKLWEVWNADDITWKQVSGSSDRKGTGVYDGQWTNMMPLSANALSELDEEEIITDPPAQSTSLSPSPTDHIPSLRQAMSGSWPLTRSNWRRHPVEPEPAAEKDVSELQSPRASTTPSKTLRVGVAILLPCPQYPIYVKQRTINGYPEEKSPRRRKEPPDYSIGLYDCSWE